MSRTAQLTSDELLKKLLEEKRQNPDLEVEERLAQIAKIKEAELDLKHKSLFKDADERAKIVEKRLENFLELQRNKLELAGLEGQEEQAEKTKTTAKIASKYFDPITEDLFKAQDLVAKKIEDSSTVENHQLTNALEILAAQGVTLLTVEALEEAKERTVIEEAKNRFELEETLKQNQKDALLGLESVIRNSHEMEFQTSLLNLLANETAALAIAKSLGKVRLQSEVLESETIGRQGFVKESETELGGILSTIQQTVAAQITKELQVAEAQETILRQEIEELRTNEIAVLVEQASTEQEASVTASNAINSALKTIQSEAQEKDYAASIIQKAARSMLECKEAKQQLTEIRSLRQKQTEEVRQNESAQIIQEAWKGYRETLVSKTVTRAIFGALNQLENEEEAHQEAAAELVSEVIKPFITDTSNEQQPSSTTKKSGSSAKPLNERNPNILTRN
jgi:hypothetical protein